jgi:ADP-ribosylglycohydrolase
MGAAVGDAFGTTNEFTSPEAPPFPELCRGPHRDITGGGPFRLVPGQVTDDTQLATALATSLRACGRLDAVDLASRYVKWLEAAFDIGTLTGTSLAHVQRLPNGVPQREAGRKAWLGSSRLNAGNGSLMRTAPIGVFFAADADARRAASLGDSAITHFDPRCQIACAAFNSAIAVAVTTDGVATPELRAKMVRAAEEEIAASAALLAREEPGEASSIEAARVALLTDLAAARQDDPLLYGPELTLTGHGAGFVRVAFRLAFWELLHAPSYDAALTDVVNRGGDADTNGAIAGALLGACYGEAAIPARWREKVLGALATRPGPLRDVYHPRQLMLLVEE